MKYKVLFFDLDDTLIDNLENVKYAYYEIMRESGYGDLNHSFDDWYLFDKKFWKEYDDGKIIVPEEYKEPLPKMVEWVQSQRPLRYFHEFLNIDMGLEEAIHFNQRYMELLKEMVIPVEGAYETLEYLFEKGYYIVVATNGAKNAVEAKLDKINCLSFVSTVVTATDIGYRKPDAKFFQGMIELVGNVDYSDCLMIGNSFREDVVGAESCGIDACWYDRGEEEIGSMRPKMIIKKLKDLKEKL